MNKIFFSGFVVFSAVLSILLFIEAVGGLISGVFPITLWLVPTIVFGIATIATLPRHPKTKPVGWQTWLTVILYTGLLAGYFALNAWRFGPFGIFLALVALALPVVSLRMTKTLDE